MIDKEGFRENIGILLSNVEGKIFLAKRTKQTAWQLPQGGIQLGESLEAALYRELKEEVGLKPESVDIVAKSRTWQRYRIPKAFWRQPKPECIGQKQRWFLLKLLVADSAIVLNHTASPEFDAWQWVEYWYPLRQIITFKKTVYRRILREFFPIFSENLGLTENTFARPLHHFLDQVN